MFEKLQATVSKLIEPLALTIPDTSKAIGVGIGTIYNLINEKRLETISIGRRRLVVYQSIKDLVSTAGA
jgi:hypothetical protein